MSEEEVPSPPPAAEGDEHKTSEGFAVAPDPTPAKWEMPKPVFRTSSGTLPANFGERAASAVAAPNAEGAPPMQAPAVPPSDITPQPDLSEVLTPEPPANVAAPTAAKRSGKGPVLIVLALLFLAAAIAAILAAAYFWYSYQSAT